MLLRLLILLIQLKKTDYDTKINGIEKKITDHDHSNKYITTKELNKLTAESFAARLKQQMQQLKMINFIEKADCDDKLKKLNKKLPQRFRG